MNNTNKTSKFIYLFLLASLVHNSTVCTQEIVKENDNQFEVAEQPSWWDKLTTSLGLSPERKRSLSKNKKKLGLVTAGAMTVAGAIAAIYGGYIKYQGMQTNRLMSERLKEISQNIKRKSLRDMQDEFAQKRIEVNFSNKEDLNKYLTTGRTPLMEAVRSEDYDLAFNLINSGADMNLQSRGLDKNLKTGKEEESRNTALIMATIRGNIDLVELLVISGANLDIKDSKGRTALGNAEYKMNEYRIGTKGRSKYQEIRNYLANPGLTMRMREVGKEQRAALPQEFK